MQLKTCGIHLSAHVLCTSIVRHKSIRAKTQNHDYAYEFLNRLCGLRVLHYLFRITRCFNFKLKLNSLTKYTMNFPLRAERKAGKEGQRKKHTLKMTLKINYNYEMVILQKLLIEANVAKLRQIHAATAAVTRGMSHIEVCVCVFSSNANQLNGNCYTGNRFAPFFHRYHTSCGTFHTFFTRSLVHLAMPFLLPVVPFTLNVSPFLPNISTIGFCAYAMTSLHATTPLIRIIFTLFDEMPLPYEMLPKPTVDPFFCDMPVVPAQTVRILRFQRTFGRDSSIKAHPNKIDQQD